MVDVDGAVAAHTGSHAIQAAGHHLGDGYSTQANMMKNATVWDAMARAYESSDGDLAEQAISTKSATEAPPRPAALTAGRAAPFGPGGCTGSRR